jgi:hypothetical protein
MGYLTNDRHSDAVQSPSMSETHIYGPAMTGCYQTSLTVPVGCSSTVKTVNILQSVDPQCGTPMAQDLCAALGSSCRA